MTRLIRHIPIVVLFLYSLQPGFAQVDSCNAWVLYYSVQKTEDKQFAYHLNVMSNCYLEAYPKLVSFKDKPANLENIKEEEIYFSEFYSYGEYPYSVHSHTLYRDDFVDSKDLHLYLFTMMQKIAFPEGGFNLFINPKNSIRYQMAKQSILLGITEEWKSGKLLIYQGDKYHHGLDLKRNDKTAEIEIDLTGQVKQFCKEFGNYLRFIFISSETDEILYADPHFRLHPAQFGLENWEKIPHKNK